MNSLDLVLNTENYYTKEVDREYMSCSQYQNFMECEAKALAKLDGRWVDEDSEAFAVGKYFHCYFEGKEAFEKYCQENASDIYKTKNNKDGTITITGKYAPYEKADKMIVCAENEPLIQKFIDMQGENEMIMTGKIFGVNWKIRLDKYIPATRLILDWKTCANIQELKYNPKSKKQETFVESYGYMMRAAVYCEIEKQVTEKEESANFILVCISKQDYPDKEIVMLNHKARFEYELDLIKNNLARIMRIKEKSIFPKRCGYCDYCRATKKLKGIIPYYKLDPEFKDAREEDYAVEGESLENTQTP